jgi:hypothetical protein
MAQLFWVIKSWFKHQSFFFWGWFNHDFTWFHQHVGDSPAQRLAASGGVLAGGVLWDLCVPHEAVAASGDTTRISVKDSVY